MTSFLKQSKNQAKKQWAGLESGMQAAIPSVKKSFQDELNASY